VDGLRWEDYVLASGDEEVSKLWSTAVELERRVTFVLGVGFDPRALVALRSLLTHAGNKVVQVVRLGLPLAEDDDLTRELTQANDRCLKELAQAGVVQVESIAYPDGVESQAASLRMSRQIQSSGVIGEKDLVVVDVSGLPSTVYFPVIGGLLKASDDQGLQRDLQVVVCENPELDRIILEEGVASPGPISGFRQRLDLDDTSGTLVWVPVLGEHQLYRGLCRLSDRYTKALAPLGNVTVVTSVHGSKVMSVGALLAAYEKNLSVVSVGPTSYRIQPGVDLDKVTADNHLICL